jgi:hypothetical protein
VTDQSQSGPPEGADAGSEPVADVPAALGPDAPVEAPAAVAPLEPDDPPVVSPAPAPAPAPVPPVSDWRPEDDRSSGGPAAMAAERPEIAVGAAFAGGLVLALILKRLAR